jgi:nucleoside-diphosphate-sugar epimerase
MRPGCNLPLRTILLGSISTTPISEASDTLASNAYTAMKLFCEKMIEEFCLRNEIHLDILRSGHLYGEGDETFDKLIPNLFRSIFDDFQVKLHIGLAQELNLLYVKDAAKIICEVASKDFGGGILNLVSSFPVTVGKLLEIMEAISLNKLKVEQLGSHFDNSQYNFQASKLHEKWEFLETPLETGLHEVYVSWGNRIK